MCCLRESCSLPVTVWLTDSRVAELLAQAVPVSCPETTKALRTAFLCCPVCIFLCLQIQQMAAMADEMGPKSVAVLVSWDANDHGGNVHFEVGGDMCMSAVTTSMCC